MTWFGPAYPETREIIAHLKDKTSIRGILTERTRDYLTIKKAQIVTAGATSAVMDGEAFVFRNEVSFIQVLGYRD